VICLGLAVNLIDEQKDLLRFLVSQHELHGGEEFLLVRSLTSAGLVYPGGGPSVPVEYDDSDFRQLRREGLITLTRVQANVHRGKPTQLGITLVQRGFALPGVKPVRPVQPLGQADSTRFASPRTGTSHPSRKPKPSKAWSSSRPHLPLAVHESVAEIEGRTRRLLNGCRKMPQRCSERPPAFV
jgi:hypothetical protein